MYFCKRFFLPGDGISIMDIKRQEMVYFFFLTSTASREKMRNVFENSFPLYEKGETPFLILTSVLINPNYFRNKTFLTSFM